jgi:preprotein translocase subunit SecB
MSQLPLFPLQLADAYLYQASATRVPVPDAKSGDEPTAEIFAHSWHIQEDDRILVVVIGARVGVTFRDGHVLKVECATAGHFRSADKLTSASVAEFVETSAMLLIYPYLRANVGEVARLTGISVPPLPTLDVAGVAAALRTGRAEQAPRKRRPRRTPKMPAPPSPDSTEPSGDSLT